MIQAYEEEVKKHLTPQRFYHSQCVMEEAKKLAAFWGADEKKAALAGILHDIMKDTPGEEQLKMMERFGIMLTDTQKANPKLWHSLCGAAYLEHVLGIQDKEVLEAVRCHTSGKKDMTLLEKVLFVADYMSADRDYPGVERMREKAYKSLDAAIVEGISFTVSELMERQAPVSADSIDAYNDAIRQLSRNQES